MPETSNFWDDILPWVDPARCQRCADCPSIAACLAQGLRRDDQDSVPAADPDFCFGCYSCVAACPYHAIDLPNKRAKL